MKEEMRDQMTGRKTENMEETEDKLFFEKFYEQYNLFLYYIARQKCNNEDDVNEVVQEALLRLLKNISVLKEINAAKTQKYIALTVRAVFLDLEKKKHADMAIPLDEAIMEALHCDGMQIEREMEGIDRKGQLQRLKDGLSDRDWFVLEGKYIVGYSDAELAQQMGVAPNSIRMILSRAKKKARAILRPEKNGGDCDE